MWSKHVAAAAACQFSPSSSTSGFDDNFDERRKLQTEKLLKRWRFCNRNSSLFGHGRFVECKALPQHEYEGVDLKCPETPKIISERDLPFSTRAFRFVKNLPWYLFADSEDPNQGIQIDSRFADTGHLPLRQLFRRKPKKILQDKSSALTMGDSIDGKDNRFDDEFRKGWRYLLYTGKFHVKIGSGFMPTDPMNAKHLLWLSYRYSVITGMYHIVEAGRQIARRKDQFDPELPESWTRVGFTKNNGGNDGVFRLYVIGALYKTEGCIQWDKLLRDLRDLLPNVLLHKFNVKLN